MRDYQRAVVVEHGALKEGIVPDKLGGGADKYIESEVVLAVAHMIIVMKRTIGSHLIGYVVQQGMPVEIEQVKLKREEDIIKYQAGINATFQVCLQELMRSPSVFPVPIVHKDCQ